MVGRAFAFMSRGAGGGGYLKRKDIENVLCHFVPVVRPSVRIPFSSVLVAARSFWLLYARACVFTTQQRAVRDPNGHLCLIPFMDMLNHDSAHTNVLKQSRY
jgi:hypothetical protein